MKQLKITDTVHYPGRTTNGMDFVAYLEGNETVFSVFGRTAEEAHENAARLAACWNAFDGCTLERIAEVGAAMTQGDGTQ